MSPTSQQVGTGRSKPRRTRSGRSGASGSGTVVRLGARGWTPRIPSSRMSLRTRYSVTPGKRGATSASSVRAPGIPRAASCSPRTASRAAAHGSLSERGLRSHA